MPYLQAVRNYWLVLAIRSLLMSYLILNLYLNNCIVNFYCIVKFYCCTALLVVVVLSY